MAGAGFKTFVDGDILTAAQVNTYLMQQSVMVFADAAARTSGIAAPSEGMITYLVDTNAVEKYTGASWVNVNDNTDAILKTIVDAKGDLIAGTAADTVDRLAVGTNGQVLTADSSTSTGLKWATAAGAGKIKQVLSTFKNDGFSSTSTTNVDVTGLSVSITPSSASNKVLVLVSYYIEASAGIVLLDLVRGSTVIGSGSGGSTFNSSTGGGGGQGGSYHYLDSPATTSATTYKIQGRITTAGTWYVGRNSVDNWRQGISITAMEVEP